jgi:hypothetical protein
MSQMTSVNCQRVIHSHFDDFSFEHPLRICFVQKIKMSEIFFERYNFFRSESCGRPNRDLSATFQPRRPPHSSRTTRTSRRCERTYKISGGAHSVPKSKISTQPHKTHLDHKTRRGIKPAPADHFKLGNRLARENTTRLESSRKNNSTHRNHPPPRRRT